MSLGGYYAPRAAAFEKRLAACVAWGARWDNAGSHGRILRDPNAARSVTGWVEHALWYYGARTPEDAYAKIAQMTLEGVADKITCPLLVVHGEADRQVPLEQAERTVRAAVASPRAELRVFTAEEGGAEHVGGDLFSPTIDYIADWVADVLANEARSDRFFSCRPRRSSGRSIWAFFPSTTSRWRRRRPLRPTSSARGSPTAPGMSASA